MGNHGEYPWISMMNHGISIYLLRMSIYLISMVNICSLGLKLSYWASVWGFPQLGVPKMDGLADYDSMGWNRPVGPPYIHQIKVGNGKQWWISMNIPINGSILSRFISTWYLGTSWEIIVNVHEWSWIQWELLLLIYC